MSLCAGCQELVGKPKSVAPHPSLVRKSQVSLGRAARGMATGYVTHYECKTCGASISCDGDDKDADAGWYQPYQYRA